MRSVSALLLFSFLLQDISYANPDPATLARVFPVQISVPRFPQSVAVVEDFWASAGATRRFAPTIYLVHDAHANESAQLNIAKALGVLLDDFQKGDPAGRPYIFLEAGTGNASLSFLRRYGTPERRESVAKKYLKRGYLQGPDYLDITSDRPLMLWGVEDKALYRESLECYKTLAGKREFLNAYLDKVERALKTLKPKLFHPLLMRFDEAREDYLKNRISLTDYFDVLLREAARLGIRADLFPNLSRLKTIREKELAIDFKKADDEQVQAAASLSPNDQRELVEASAKARETYRLDASNHAESKAFFALLREKLLAQRSAGLNLRYVELFKYLDYLREIQSLDSALLLSEIDSLEGMVFDSLAGTTRRIPSAVDEKTLVQITKSLEILRRLVNLKATSADLEAIGGNPLAFDIVEMSGFLNKKLMDLESHYEDALFLSPDYDKGFQAALRFYDLARRRDVKFLENIFKKLSSPKSFVGDEPDSRFRGNDRCVLVTGGYHAEHLKKLFKKKGISYVSIVPQVLQETSTKKYEEILLGRPAAASRQLAANKLGYPSARTLEVNGTRLMTNLLNEFHSAPGARFARRSPIAKSHRGLKDFIAADLTSAEGEDVTAELVSAVDPELERTRQLLLKFLPLEVHRILQIMGNRTHWVNSRTPKAWELPQRNPGLKPVRWRESLLDDYEGRGGRSVSVHPFPPLPGHVIDIKGAGSGRSTSPILLTPGDAPLSHRLWFGNLEALALKEMLTVLQIQRVAMAALGRPVALANPLQIIRVKEIPYRGDFVGVSDYFYRSFLRRWGERKSRKFMQEFLDVRRSRIPKLPLKPLFEAFFEQIPLAQLRSWMPADIRPWDLGTGLPSDRMRVLPANIHLHDFFEEIFSAHGQKFRPPKSFKKRRPNPRSLSRIEKYYEEVGGLNSKGIGCILEKAASNLGSVVGVVIGIGGSIHLSLLRRNLPGFSWPKDFDDAEQIRLPGDSKFRPSVARNGILSMMYYASAVLGQLSMALRRDHYFSSLANYKFGIAFWEAFNSVQEKVMKRGAGGRIFHPRYAAQYRSWLRKRGRTLVRSSFDSAFGARFATKAPANPASTLVLSKQDAGARFANLLVSPREKELLRRISPRPVRGHRSTVGSRKAWKKSMEVLLDRFIQIMHHPGLMNYFESVWQLSNPRLSQKPVARSAFFFPTNDKLASVPTGAKNGALIGVSAEQLFGLAASSRSRVIFAVDREPTVTDIIIPFLGMLFLASGTRTDWLSYVYGIPLGAVEKWLLDHADARGRRYYFYLTQFLLQKQAAEFQSYIIMAAAKILSAFLGPSVSIKEIEGVLSVFYHRANQLVWENIHLINRSIQWWERSGYLRSELGFQHVKGLWERSKVFGAVIDIADAGQLVPIFQCLKSTGLPLGIFYVSNVSQTVGLRVLLNAVHRAVSQVGSNLKPKAVIHAEPRSLRPKGGLFYQMTTRFATKAPANLRPATRPGGPSLGANGARLADEKGDSSREINAGHLEGIDDFLITLGAAVRANAGFSSSFMQNQDSPTLNFWLELSLKMDKDFEEALNRVNSAAILSVFARNVDLLWRVLKLDEGISRRALTPYLELIEQRIQKLNAEQSTPLPKPGARLVDSTRPASFASRSKTGGARSPQAGGPVLSEGVKGGRVEGARLALPKTPEELQDIFNHDYQGFREMNEYLGRLPSYPEREIMLFLGILEQAILDLKVPSHPQDFFSAILSGLRTLVGTAYPPFQDRPEVHHRLAGLLSIFESAEADWIRARITSSPEVDLAESELWLLLSDYGVGETQSGSINILGALSSAQDYSDERFRAVALYLAEHFRSICLEEKPIDESVVGMLCDFVNERGTQRMSRDTAGYMIESVAQIMNQKEKDEQRLQLVRYILGELKLPPAMNPSYLLNHPLMKEVIDYLAENFLDDPKVRIHPDLIDRDMFFKLINFYKYYSGKELSYGDAGGILFRAAYFAKKHFAGARAATHAPAALTRPPRNLAGARLPEDGKGPSAGIRHLGQLWRWWMNAVSTRERFVRENASFSIWDSWVYPVLLIIDALVLFYLLILSLFRIELPLAADYFLKSVVPISLLIGFGHYLYFYYQDRNKLVSVFDRSVHDLYLEITGTKETETALRPYARRLSAILNVMLKLETLWLGTGPVKDSFFPVERLNDLWPLINQLDVLERQAGLTKSDDFRRLVAMVEGIETEMSSFFFLFGKGSSPDKVHAHADSILWDQMKILQSQIGRLSQGARAAGNDGAPLGRIALTLDGLVDGLKEVNKPRPEIKDVASVLGVSAQSISRFQTKRVDLRRLRIWAIPLPDNKADFERLIDYALARLRSGDPDFKGRPIDARDLAAELCLTEFGKIARKCKAFGINLSEKGVFSYQDRSEQRERYYRYYLKKIGLEPNDANLVFLLKPGRPWLEKRGIDPDRLIVIPLERLKKIRDEWRSQLEARRRRDRDRYIQSLKVRAEYHLKRALKKRDAGAIKSAIFELKIMDPANPMLTERPSHPQSKPKPIRSPKITPSAAKDGKVEEPPRDEDDYSEETIPGEPRSAPEIPAKKPRATPSNRESREMLTPGWDALEKDFEKTAAEAKIAKSKEDPLNWKAVLLYKIDILNGSLKGKTGFSEEQIKKILFFRLKPLAEKTFAASKKKQAPKNVFSTHVYTLIRQDVAQALQDYAERRYLAAGVDPNQVLGEDLKQIVSSGARLAKAKQGWVAMPPMPFKTEPLSEGLLKRLPGMKNLQARAAAIRAERKKSLAAMARAAGMPPSTYFEMENQNRTMPHPRNVLKAARALRVPTAYLTDGSLSVAYPGVLIALRILQGMTQEDLAIALRRANKKFFGNFKAAHLRRKISDWEIGRGIPYREAWVFFRRVLKSPDLFRGMEESAQKRRLRHLPELDPDVRRKLVNWYRRGIGVKPGEEFRVWVIPGKAFIARYDGQLAPFSFIKLSGSKPVEMVFKFQKDENREELFLNIYPAVGVHKAQTGVEEPFVIYGYNSEKGRAEQVEPAVMDAVDIWNGEGDRLKTYGRIFRTTLYESSPGQWVCQFRHKTTRVRPTVTGKHKTSDPVVVQTTAPTDVYGAGFKVYNAAEFDETEKTGILPNPIAAYIGNKKVRHRAPRPAGPVGAKRAYRRKSNPRPVRERVEEDRIKMEEARWKAAEEKLREAQVRRKVEALAKSEWKIEWLRLLKNLARATMDRNVPAQSKSLDEMQGWFETCLLNPGLKSEPFFQNKLDFSTGFTFFNHLAKNYPQLLEFPTGSFEEERQKLIKKTPPKLAEDVKARLTAVSKIPPFTETGEMVYMVLAKIANGDNRQRFIDAHRWMVIHRAILFAGQDETRFQSAVFEGYKLLSHLLDAWKIENPDSYSEVLSLKLQSISGLASGQTGARLAEDLGFPASVEMTDEQGMRVVVEGTLKNIQQAWSDFESFNNTTTFLEGPTSADALRMATKQLAENIGMFDGMDQNLVWVLLSLTVLGNSLLNAEETALKLISREAGVKVQDLLDNLIRELAQALEHAQKLLASHSRVSSGVPVPNNFTEAGTNLQAIVSQIQLALNQANAIQNVRSAHSGVSASKPSPLASLAPAILSMASLRLNAPHVLASDPGRLGIPPDVIAENTIAIETLGDSLEAFYGRPPVLETVFDAKHEYFWATSLRYNGHNLMIRMNQSTWGNEATLAPVYDIFIDSDPDGYQTYLSIRLNENGTVSSQETLRNLSIKYSTRQAAPWVEPLLRNWIRWLDGHSIDRHGLLLGQFPVYSVDFRTSRLGFPVYRPTTYVPGKHGVVQLPSPIGDPGGFKTPDFVFERKTLVFYGGLGAVVPRFYLEYLHELSERYGIDCVAVDLLPAGEAETRIKSLGLPYKQYYHASDFKIDAKNPPAGVVILTRPDSHYDLVRTANEAGIPVFVEKPLVHPRHLRPVIEHYRRHPGELFAIDFFFDNPSVRKALEYIDAGKIGRVRALRGEMIEKTSPGQKHPIEAGREWLVHPEISGGGLGMDMMVHLTALAEMLLERWGKTLRHSELDPRSLVFARYEGAPAGTETYARVEGRVDGNVLIQFGAGKGLHRSAYYLVVEGDEGKIEINLGTEAEKGFMKFTPQRGPEEKIENPTSDIGYAGTVRKILHGAQFPREISQAERDFRVSATSISVWLLDLAQWMFGDNYYSIPVGQDPAQIRLEDRGAKTWQDRYREELRMADELIFDLQGHFERQDIRIPLGAQSSGVQARVRVDRYLAISVDGITVGFLDLSPRTKKAGIWIDHLPAGVNVQELESVIKPVVEKSGWKWQGIQNSEPAAAGAHSERGARLTRSQNTLKILVEHPLRLEHDLSRDSSVLRTYLESGDPQLIRGAVFLLEEKGDNDLQDLLWEDLIKVLRLKREGLVHARAKAVDILSRILLRTPKDKPNTVRIRRVKLALRKATARGEKSLVRQHARAARRAISQRSKSSAAGARLASVDFSDPNKKLDFSRFKMPRKWQAHFRRKDIPNSWVRWMRYLMGSDESNTMSFFFGKGVKRRNFTQTDFNKFVRWVRRNNTDTLGYGFASGGLDFYKKFELFPKIGQKEYGPLFSDHAIGFFDLLQTLLEIKGQKKLQGIIRITRVGETNHTYAVDMDIDRVEKVLVGSKNLFSLGEQVPAVIFNQPDGTSYTVTFVSRVSHPIGSQEGTTVSFNEIGTLNENRPLTVLFDHNLNPPPRDLSRLPLLRIVRRGRRVIVTCRNVDEDVFLIYRKSAGARAATKTPADLASAAKQGAGARLAGLALDKTKIWFKGKGFGFEDFPSLVQMLRDLKLLPNRYTLQFSEDYLKNGRLDISDNAPSPNERIFHFENGSGENDLTKERGREKLVIFLAEVIEEALAEQDSRAAQILKEKAAQGCTVLYAVLDRYNLPVAFSMNSTPKEEGERRIKLVKTPPHGHWRIEGIYPKEIDLSDLLRLLSRYEKSLASTRVTAKSLGVSKGPLAGARAASHTEHVPQFEPKVLVMGKHAVGGTTSVMRHVVESIPLLRPGNVLFIYFDRALAGEKVRIFIKNDSSNSGWTEKGEAEISPDGIAHFPITRAAKSFHVEYLYERSFFQRLFSFGRALDPAKWGIRKIEIRAGGLVLSEGAKGGRVKGARLADWVQLERRERLFQNSIIFTPEGLLVPHAVYVEGQEEGSPPFGNYENSMIWMNLLWAAESWAYTATNDPSKMISAKKLYGAWKKLQDVTKKPGVIARAFKQGNKKTWDEDYFWADRSGQEEWHQAGDYRWLGDMSKGQFFALFFGALFYYDEIADRADRAEIQKRIRGIVDFLIKNNYQIIDLDGKPTTHGNFNPHPLLFGRDGLKVLLLLAILKIAHHMTADPFYESEYLKLAKDRGFARMAQNASVSIFGLPHNHSDIHLSHLGYFILLQLERDEELLALYRKGMENTHVLVQNEKNPLFNFLYQIITRDDHAYGDAIESLQSYLLSQSVPVIAHWPKVDRRITRRNRLKQVFGRKGPIRGEIVPFSEAIPDEYTPRRDPFKVASWQEDLGLGKKGSMKFSDVGYIFTYWLGRKYDLVGSAAGARAATHAPAALTRPPRNLVGARFATKTPANLASAAKQGAGARAATHTPAALAPVAPVLPKQAGRNEVDRGARLVSGAPNSKLKPTREALGAAMLQEQYRKEFPHDYGLLLVLVGEQILRDPDLRRFFERLIQFEKHPISENRAQYFASLLRLEQNFNPGDYPMNYGGHQTIQYPDLPDDFLEWAVKMNLPLSEFPSAYSLYLKLISQERRRQGKDTHVRLRPGNQLGQGLWRKIIKKRREKIPKPALQVYKGDIVSSEPLHWIRMPADPSTPDFEIGFHRPSQLGREGVYDVYLFTKNADFIGKAVEKLGANRTPSIPVAYAQIRLFNGIPVVMVFQPRFYLPYSADPFLKKYMEDSIVTFAGLLEVSIQKILGSKKSPSKIRFITPSHYLDNPRVAENTLLHYYLRIPLLRGYSLRVLENPITATSKKIHFVFEKSLSVKTKGARLVTRQKDVKPADRSLQAAAAPKVETNGARLTWTNQTAKDFSYHAFSYIAQLMGGYELWFGSPDIKRIVSANVYISVLYNLSLMDKGVELQWHYNTYQYKPMIMNTMNTVKLVCDVSKPQDASFRADFRLVRGNLIYTNKLTQPFEEKDFETLRTDVIIFEDLTTDQVQKAIQTKFLEFVKAAHEELKSQGRLPSLEYALSEQFADRAVQEMKEQGIFPEVLPVEGQTTLSQFLHLKSGFAHEDTVEAVRIHSPAKKDLRIPRGELPEFKDFELNTGDVVIVEGRNAGARFSALPFTASAAASAVSVRRPKVETASASMFDLLKLENFFTKVALANPEVKDGPSISLQVSKNSAPTIFVYRNEGDHLVAVAESAGIRLELDTSNQNRVRIQSENTKTTSSVADIKLMEDTLKAQCLNQATESMSTDPVVIQIDVDAVDEGFLRYAIPSVRGSRFGKNVYFMPVGSPVSVQRALALGIFDETLPPDLKERGAKTVLIQSTEGARLADVNLYLSLPEGGVLSSAVLYFAIFAGRADLSNMPDGLVSAYEKLSGSIDRATLRLVLLGKAARDIIRQFAIRSLIQTTLQQAAQYYRNAERIAQAA